jgi:hypothetical protein
LGDLCGEKMVLVRDDVGNGFFQCEEIWTDVLYLIYGTGAEKMVRASVWMVSDMSHDRHRKEVRVVVAALRWDVGGHKGCEYRSHLLLMVADDVLDGLGE